MSDQLFIRDRHVQATNTNTPNLSAMQCLRVNARHGGSYGLLTGTMNA